MGKRTAVLFITVIFMLLEVSNIVCADDYKTYNGFDYMINLDGNIEIVRYSGNDENVKIPDLIDGMTVKVISGSAFSGNEKIKSVYIPEGILKIEEGTFEDCINLEKITGAENVLNIRGDAFEDTAFWNGQSDGLVYVGNCCYKYKGDIDENTVADIKKETRGISENAFEGCENLKKINFEGSKDEWDSINIETQGNDVVFKVDIFFKETGEALCSNESFRYFIDTRNEITILEAVTKNYPEKTKIIFPGRIENKNVVCIESGAFESCVGLSEIGFENGIKNIGERAFADCCDLRFVTLSDSLEVIGKDAFKNTSLYNNMSGNIFYIGKWCLGYKEDDSESKDLKIQRNTVGIASNAFYGINAVNVFFPQTVMYINHNAFGKANVHGIFFEGSQKEWNRISVAWGNEALDGDNISFNTTIEKREEYIYKDLCVALFFIIAFLVIALFLCISRITVQKNEILRLTVVIEKLKKRKASARPANKPK